MLILAGITINALTGSDSAPAKANEAEQKNDIGSAKDQINLTAVNAKTEAYDTAYVGNGVSGTEAATTIGQAVIDSVLPYNGKTIGKASIEVTQAETNSIKGDATITITTRDFKEYGLIELSGGTLKWITPVPITFIGAINASDTEVKETKTITLTAEINSDATESLTWTSSNPSVATVTSTGKNTAEVRGVEEQAGNPVTITASYGNLTPVTIEITVIENAATSYVGKYVDLDGNNTIDGIIYADLLAQKPTGDWVNSSGYYELPATEAEENYRTYEISQTNQVPKNPSDNTKNLFDSTGRDVVKLADGNQDGKSKRFYVMQLTDYNNGTAYDWLTAKALTATTTVGTITYTWKCPTRQEWSMFGKAFDFPTNVYVNYGFIDDNYWSSSDKSGTYAPCADFIKGITSVNASYQRKVRLCTTF